MAASGEPLINKSGSERRWTVFRASLLWPFAAFLEFWPLLASLCRGDSFYATALKRFYLRQFRLIAGQVHYPEFLGNANSWALIYQNFLASQLCYVVFGRRLFVVTSIVILVLFYFGTRPASFAAYMITGIFVTSQIALFIFSERGNYQTLGLVVSCIALYILQTEGFGASYLYLAVLTLLLSTSAFVLAGLIGVFTSGDLLTYLIANMGLVLGFLLFNFVLMRRLHSSRSGEGIGARGLLRQLAAGVISVLGSVGLTKQTVQTAPLPLRRVSIARGAASALPFIGGALLLPQGVLLVCIAGAVIIFFNQSKILRLFDFHFVFFYFFCLLYLGIDAESVRPLDYAVLFIIGSNPLILYGLNRANASAEERASRFIVPLVLDREREVLALERLQRIFLDTRRALIDDGLRSRSPEYNDIFANNSLLLEFVWDSFPADAEMFPDWYSLFLTDNGVQYYRQMARGDFSRFVGFNRISFRQNQQVEEQSSDLRAVPHLDLAELFGADICERYFPRARYMIVESVS